MNWVWERWIIYKGKLFSNQTFSHTNTPTFLKPIHSSHLPAFEDGTECSDTSVYEIQAPGNYPEESIQQFNIQQLYALPTLYLCVLYLAENKQRLVPLTA
jgi:hypothetical protein